MLNHPQIGYIGLKKINTKTPDPKMTVPVCE